MEYGLSIWAIVYRNGHPPYRYSHPRYRYGIWYNDMGDDSIDMGDDSIDMGDDHIDMGYLVTLPAALHQQRVPRALQLPRDRGLHSSTFRLNVSTFCGIR